MQPVNPLDHPGWDASLTRRPDFSFFHGAAWSRVLFETYDYRPVWQKAADALLPLMEVDSWLTGRRGIALPFTDHCGPLCGTEAELRVLFEGAVRWGRSRGWKSIELRGGREFLPDAPSSLAFYGHYLSLSAEETKMFESLGGSARQAVRKAEKDGVTVEISQSEEGVRSFYNLQCLTRQRHGLPPQPIDFFLNIWRYILSQNQGMIALANWRGSPIAGAVFFYLGGNAIYKYGASDLSHQQARPNNLVMWSGMRWLARQGVRRLHLGKTALGNHGLRRFKANLGAAEERLEYVKFDLRAGRFVVEEDAISGWHNRVFRHLPGFLSRRAGELLYKHWA